MTRLLVTGANGFVGRWLVRAARALGHHVVASVLPGTPVPAEWSGGDNAADVQVLAADILVEEDVGLLADTRAEAVIHLAGVASSADARRDPAMAARVNTVATRALAEHVATSGTRRFLFVSSAEVYGAGHAGPIEESARIEPASPYATSKAEAEVSLAAVSERTGLEVVVARPFPHSGPGQSAAFVLPALANRLLEAKRAGSSVIAAGNLDAVRDFTDVRDVARAYLLLLDRGVPGEAYNVASGVGRCLRDCLELLERIVQVEVSVTEDASLLRPGDIPVLIGSPVRMHRTTGWRPEIPFERTLQDLVDAQTH